MIKTVLYSVFLLLSVFSLKAQENLVPNGSFEEYNWCPDYANGYFIDACKYWTSVTLGGSPDYFNVCSTEYDVFFQKYMFSVPENYLAYQYAHTGNAYAGLGYSQVNDPNVSAINQTYSEYIQIKLKNSLTEGNSYMLKFYISNADTTFCGNSIGAYFSPMELNINTEHNLEVVPQYQSDLSFFFCDSVKWFEQIYQFIADGTEQYLIIGVFTLLYDSQMSDYNGNIVSGTGQFGTAGYFYIDDVSLTEVDYTSLIPNVFTPNSDNINDYYNLVDIPQGFSLTILNRWGDIVFQTEKANVEFWDGKYQGKNCADGVYFYILNNKNNSFKKTGFIQLIR